MGDQPNVTCEPLLAEVGSRTAENDLHRHADYCLPITFGYIYDRVNRRPPRLK